MNIRIFALAALIAVGSTGGVSASTCDDGYKMGEGLEQKASAHWKRYLYDYNEFKKNVQKKVGEQMLCKSMGNVLGTLRQVVSSYQQAWHMYESGLDSGSLFYCHDVDKRNYLRSRANKAKSIFKKESEKLRRGEAHHKKHCR